VGTHSAAAFDVVKMVFEVEPGLLIPAVAVTAKTHPQDRPTLVRVGADWQKELTTGEPERLMRKGKSIRILYFDPRGMGETNPDSTGERGGSPFGPDWKEAFLALHLDRPLLGQRVADVLTVLESFHAAGTRNPKGEFEVVGIGRAATVVLHAAFLDEGGLIKKVALERSLYSWSDVLERKLSRDQLANVVVGALAVYDLPDFAARLAPRPLSIRGPVDAMGDPVSRTVLDQEYAKCAAAYAAKGGVLELEAADRHERK
jgi:hypothetical protein